MVMQDILVTRDRGWWKSSAFLVIGELTNLILVIGDLRGGGGIYPKWREYVHNLDPITFIYGANRGFLGVFF